MRSSSSLLLAASVLVACGGAEPTTTQDASSTGDTSTGTGTSGSTSSGGAATTTGTGAGSSSTGAATTGGPTSTGDDTTTGAGCPPATLQPGDQVVAVDHGGMMRTATVHVPPDLDLQVPAPLVLNFHGFGSNSGQQAFFSGMTPFADSEGFILAYPQGFMNSWNGGACCGEAVAQDIDDIGFVRALVAELSSRACIDAKRIYATGMSNGGFISHRLACEAADLVAAVAPVSAVNGMPVCAPSRPVPVLMFNGTEDTLVSYDLVAPTFSDWGQRDNCVGGPSAGPTIGAASSETFAECDGGVTVTQWTLEGMGHCWPGQEFCPFGTSNLDVAANPEMWAFFGQHTLP
jgi:polyhydroxybutyrate depolymerase